MGHTKKSKVARAYDGFARLEVESICQHTRESREEKKNLIWQLLRGRCRCARPIVWAQRATGSKTAREGYGIGGLHNEDRRIQAHSHILSLVSPLD